MEIPFQHQSYYYADSIFRHRTENLAWAYQSPTGYIPPHAHDFYEMIFILSGKGTHTIGGQTVPVKGGELFLVPPDTMHGYSDGEMQVFYLLMRKEFITRYYEELSHVPGFSLLFEVEPYLRQTYDGRFYLTVSPSQKYEIQQLFASVAARKDAVYDSYRAVEALHLISRISLLMQEAGRQNRKSREQDYAVVAAIDYIRSHLGEKIQVDTLAADAHMSRSTFLRHFKRMTQTTPNVYLTQCRVQEALRLLKTDLPKSAVAQVCGFYDVSHMNKYLK